MNAAVVHRWFGVVYILIVATLSPLKSSESRMTASWSCTVFDLIVRAQALFLLVSTVTYAHMGDPILAPGTISSKLRMSCIRSFRDLKFSV